MFQRRLLVAVATCVAVCVVVCGVQLFLLRHLPSVLHLSEDRPTEAFLVPFAITARLTADDIVDIVSGDDDRGRWLGSTIALSPRTTGDVQLELRVFDLVAVRSVTVRVRSPRHVMIGGHAIGVLVDEQGLNITELTAITTRNDGQVWPARDAGLRIGDVLVAVDGVRLHDEQELLVQVQQAGREQIPLQITVIRDGSRITLAARPMWCVVARRYSLGMGLQRGTAGVGTLTCYEPETLVYVALGHAVGDMPTGQAGGRIVRALVSGVQQGKRGQPGEKIGVFIEPWRQLGTITGNSSFGIVGTLEQTLVNPIQSAPLPVATISEVRTGPAVMYTVVNGQQVEGFAVEITRVNRQRSPADRGMTIRVVDRRLLDQTGGIVQGMSGSPIVQDGKLVGAVTHVFVNDPGRGYAVFAEWMVELVAEQEPQAA